MTTILIVEDNDLNLKMARDLLQMAGYQTLEAEDATVGLSLAKKNRPDLILMDMYLPIMDGYETTKTLKADSELRDIPVIAFTALAMDQERKKAFAAGCSGFISKPIDVEKFTETIRSFLSGEGHSESVGNQSNYGLEDSEENSNQEIEEFFLIASHDLQAPLRKIDQFTSMIKRSQTSQISAEDFELLERIERVTQNMHVLVSDMLTLSRVNRKGGLFKMVDLSSIVDEAIRDNQAAIDRLDAEIQVGKMVTLKGDAVQLQQLLQILIENSLKFHQENNQPSIRIDSKPVNYGYEITISDNGIGIPEEHADKIFRPFVRLHGASSRYGGQGMGLAIAEKIVKRHKGTIQAKSLSGQGTTFIIYLPSNL